MTTQLEPRLLGERKFVTIMFADIRGSVALTSGLDPEDVDDLLSLVVGRMRAAVNRYGGTVNRMSGDGIMAIFGAPLSHEHHAEQACHAALAILSEAQFDGADREIRVRIGLHSGEVVVHDLIGDRSTYYEAMGEAVNIAARMEQSAEPGSAVLTAETKWLAGDAIQVRSLGLRDIKGVRQPIELFELAAVSQSGPRRRDLPWGSGVFVGRENEISFLLRALRGAQENSGGAVVVSGEAGSGKSRLIEEFLRHCKAANPIVIRGYAQSFGQRGYQVIISMLEGWLGFSVMDSGAALRDKIREGVAAAMPSSASGQRQTAITQALTALCDVTAADPAWLVLDPAQRRNRIASAVCDLLDLASQAVSLVLVAEDLHWADVDSVHVLGRLAEMAQARKMLLVMIFRDETSSLRAEGFRESQRLQPLSRVETATLLRSYLVHVENSDTLHEDLFAHTGGNPLFIEECLIALTETGSLEREGSHFRQVRPIRVLGLPKTIRALISARVDRLGSTEKELLQAAAVLGQTVSRDVLVGITMYAADESEGVLRSLCDAEFLVPIDSAVENGLYRYRHALTREAVYQSILLRRRRELHAKVVETIEHLHQARLIEYSEMLAEHSHRAEDWPREARYLRRSAGKAVARSSNRVAVKFLNDALVATERQSDGRDKDSTLVDVLLELRYPLFKLGELTEVSNVLSRTAGTIQGLDDPRRLGLLHAYQSHLSWVTGDSLRALNEARSSVRAAVQLSDEGLRVRARFQEGMVLTYRGEYAEGIAALSELLQHITTGFGAGIYPDAGMATVAQCYIARACAEIGDFVKARDHAEASLKLATTIDDPFSQTFAALAMGFLHLSLGDPHSAISMLECARAYAIQSETEYLVPLPGGFLGMAYVGAGRADRAIPLLEDIVAHAHRIGFRANQPYRLAALGRAYLAVDRFDDALHVASDAHRMASAQREIFSEATALCILAEIARRSNPAAAQDAEDYIARAQNLARRHGLTPIERLCMETGRTDSSR